MLLETMRLSPRFRPARALLLAVLALFGLACLAAPGRAQEPDGSPAADSQEDAPPSARELRLERDREARRTALAAMRSWPWRSRWLDAIEARWDPDARWVATSDGYLARASLAYELEWNRPAPGRQLPRWDDVEALPHPFAAIVDLERQLEAHGVELLVVPVPTRLEVYPELVLGQEDREATDWDEFAGMAEGLTSFLLRLADAGVETVDLLPAFCQDRYGEGPGGRGDQVFLKYNMHWTPRAAQLAAELVAERVRQLDGFTPGRQKRGVSFELHETRASWEPAGSRNLPADTEPEDLGFVRVTDLEGKPVRVEKHKNPILLLGDSFATHWSDYQASFSEHLYALLEQPFDRIVIRGGGVYQTRRRAAIREENGLATKKIVIWLFSATTLKDGEDWRVVDLFGDRGGSAGE